MRLKLKRYLNKAKRYKEKLYRFKNYENILNFTLVLFQLQSRHIFF